jgi:hypothetical protein
MVSKNKKNSWPQSQNCRSYLKETEEEDKCNYENTKRINPLDERSADEE